MHITDLRVVQQDMEALQRVSEGLAKRLGDMERWAGQTGSSCTCASTYAGSCTKCTTLKLTTPQCGMLVQTGARGAVEMRCSDSRHGWRPSHRTAQMAHMAQHGRVDFRCGPSGGRGWAAAGGCELGGPDPRIEMGWGRVVCGGLWVREGLCWVVRELRVRDPGLEGAYDGFRYEGACDEVYEHHCSRIHSFTSPCLPY